MRSYIAAERLLREVPQGGKLADILSLQPRLAQARKGAHVR